MIPVVDAGIEYAARRLRSRPGGRRDLRDRTRRDRPVRRGHRREGTRPCRARHRAALRLRAEDVRDAQVDIVAVRRVRRDVVEVLRVAEDVGQRNERQERLRRRIDA